jgi:hypothetical protein
MQQTAVWLPLVTNHYAPPPPTNTRLQPSDLVYLGAFRLPEGGERPFTFAYGGNAMTFNPTGNPSGAADGFAGSLFITGHDRLPYGELTNGDQVAEISIPAPVIATSLAALHRAEFIQDFQDVAQGFFNGLDEIPRLGMQYLDTPAGGPKIHLTWGQHMQEGEPAPSQAWFDPQLSAPNMQGTWFIGDRRPYSLTGYLVDIPEAWANAYAQGRRLGTGRYRGGGWSGMGPALFAYLPWTDNHGTPAPAGAHLPETTLLLYQSSIETEIIDHCLSGYQHPDEWEGAAWITNTTGKAAVLFAGTKSKGVKYWYGWANPAGPDLPCVEEEMVGQFTSAAWQMERPARRRT